MIDLTLQDIRKISDIIGDTSSGLSGADIKRTLADSGIEILDDGKRQNRNEYTIGLNKRDYLYQCLTHDLVQYHSSNRIIAYLNSIMDPGRYVKPEKRQQYEYLFENINKVLRLKGFQYDKSGALVEVPKADSLDEVDKLINEMNQRMYQRSLHQDVRKYCTEELLRKDYYDAVFEAAKGLEKRIQDMTGLHNNGQNLVETAFRTQPPYIVLNANQNLTEKSETNGVISLLISTLALYRNPPAHTLKYDWKTNQTETLDALTIVSVAHKFLDKCIVVRTNQ